MLIKQTAYKTIPPNGHPAFSTNLAVRGGDVIGLATVSNVATGYLAGNEDDVAFNVMCESTGVGQLVGEGTACPLAPNPTARINAAVRIVRR